MNPNEIDVTKLIRDKGISNAYKYSLFNIEIINYSDIAIHSKKGNKKMFFKQ